MINIILVSLQRLREWLLKPVQYVIQVTFNSCLYGSKSWLQKIDDFHKSFWRVFRQRPIRSVLVFSTLDDSAFFYLEELIRIRIIFCDQLYLKVCLVRSADLNSKSLNNCTK